MALVSRQNEGSEDAGTAKMPTLLGAGAAGGGKSAEKNGDKYATAQSTLDTTRDADKGALTKPERARATGLPPTVDYRKIQAERPTKSKPAFFTIYKSGQGYWTRIGTVAGVGIMLVFSLRFFYVELADWLAWNTQTGGIAAGPGDPFLVGLTGAVIVLMAAYALGAKTGLSIILGLISGVVTDFLCTRGSLGTGASANKSVILVFLVVYAIAFIVLSFRLMNRPSNVDFLIATDSEMKKVNWTTRAELIGSTKVVILFVILTAIFLFVVDMFFWKFFQLIHVLKGGPFG